MDKSVAVILVVLVIAVLGSFPAAKISSNKQKIYSGILGKVFHHIAVGAYIGVVPSTLLGSFVVGPLELGIPLALTGLAVSFVMLLLYALQERTARVGIDLDGQSWTQEDAKTSGL